MSAIGPALGSVTGLARAALPSVPGLNLLPGIRKTGSDPAGLSRELPATPVDQAQVASYAEVCGFPRKETLPLTYPHLLAFPLHLTLLADPAFPFPAMGSVHVENSLTSYRPIRADERLAVRVECGSVRPHTKGSLVDFVTAVSAGGEVVWEESSTYLRRGPGDPAAPAGLGFGEPPEGGIVWRLPANLGRRYARVAGDHNPIHLYPLTAKALGFPRQIAHGMWSKARCLAALENRLPPAVRVEVAWRKPILLPGTVRFSHTLSSAAALSGTPADRVDLALVSERSGTPHLLGRATPLE